MKKRPLITNAAILDNTKKLENFQNTTLRPIIKWLNDLLFVYFHNYMVLKKFDIVNSTDIQKDKFVTTIFLKDNQFKNEIKGIVIGHFTVEEYDFYKNSTKQINKRIFSIVKQRILSFN
ncbi:glyoxalase [Lutibacter citreus]|uniref:glyoxalase n=1 Tax=Lutibacter citreus TaxID=2138210 RepID=UPI000DBE9541|nr:glyoxalase [Lutibacter citreus]